MAVNHTSVSESLASMSSSGSRVTNDEGLVPEGVRDPVAVRAFGNL